MAIKRKFAPAFLTASIAVALLGGCGPTNGQGDAASRASSAAQAPDADSILALLGL